MKWFFIRKWYAFLSRRDALDRMKRCVYVENQLLKASKGQRALPDKEECLKWAKKLGGITLILITILSSGCSTIKAITYIPPKDHKPCYVRRIHPQSIDHHRRPSARVVNGNIIFPRMSYDGGFLPTYYMVPINSL